MPAPEIIACEIVEDLTAALAEFEAVAAALEASAADRTATAEDWRADCGRARGGDTDRHHPRTGPARRGTARNVGVIRSL